MPNEGLNLLAEITWGAALDPLAQVATIITLVLTAIDMFLRHRGR